MSDMSPEAQKVSAMFDELKRKTDHYYAVRDLRISLETGICQSCGENLSEHIGGKPCTVSEPSQARNLSDLPIFGWAWQADAKNNRA